MSNRTKFIVFLVVSVLFVGALSSRPDISGMFVIGGVAMLLWGLASWRRAALEQAVRVATEPHLRVLKRKRTECQLPDEYGIVSPHKWEKELAHFLNRVIIPQVAPPGLFGKWTDKHKIVAARAVRKRVTEECHKIGEQAPVTEVVAPTNGREYELFCADVLRRAGWNVFVTPPTGDQGVDLVATLANTTVAIQCKRYKQSVSNSAVMEVAAGRKHYGVQVAVVVSNSTFTPAAQKLAATNGVLLLHHSDLPKLSEMVAAKGEAA